ncbi:MULTISPECIES: LysR family transcriptional regulator [Shewanella]|uniref:LysR family transcriptional regulator n=1 Tax=Shewanella TaxID=22 RepID=UPI00118430EC|nr:MULTISPECIES: LysR family transcriptional regulator [Shewanella]QYJ91727.1 LysR family transcriptional regulator [Shewanella halotolerans]TVP09845.1 LysR family transcriptional regulator [Shewanella sp. KCT]
MSQAKSTFEQWRILQAVVDCGGYAQAAEKLNKSQSSLNHAVAKLQTQLGVALLEVRGRKAYLTESGEVLLRRSRHITRSVSELEQLASNLEKGWEPSLMISREMIYPMEHLIDALAEFEPQGRGTRITILDSVISGSAELVESEAVDLAIIGGAPPKGHLAQPLCNVDFHLVCHPSHPLASMELPLDDQTLAEQLQIVIKDTGQIARGELGWLKAERRWTVANFHEALVVLSKGLGFCWIPSHLICDAIKEGRLTRLTLKGSSHRQVPLSLVIPNRDKQGPASQLLEQLILKNHSVLEGEGEG